MDIDFSEINYLVDPCSRTLHADYEQFLLSLIGLTVIDINGENNDEWRVISTLLHGDEPSGLIGIHRWLTAENTLPRPKTNIRIIISSVEAATHQHLFHHRYMPDGIDLNRCFNEQSIRQSEYQDNQHLNGYVERARLIAHAIREVNPKAIIDIHNTSGNCPAFAVSTLISPNVLSITSYFCDTLLLSDIRIGGLMEVDFPCPVVTIECGGKMDDQAHDVAFKGIKQFAQCDSQCALPQDKAVQILYKPLRLTIKPDRKLSFSKHDENYSGVTLRDNIEQFNYGGCCDGLVLGWLDDKGLENLEMLNDQGVNVIDKYFRVDENKLLCASNLKIFMASTEKDIARSDCLFYVVNNVSNFL
ncbi:Succinylglutamate desuccinylase / Aspartoacylase family protein [Colwellia chukchiensis]|uniref:Succinylglutamate desuccinylase / Aspartoacylase family protein n=1 Tax=Colwellia chukchiensis TaxID=641665 RepID=A0A1H7KQ03_9GAMM|nr:succinylglutamate desuccinylase/aspartoacylase family protein [Colwellia chukchiensis]SEK88027.1 Succinylglutamate desuccinylase / Aspartoacylase family protein [Colwellia chukchiensis]